MTAHVTVGVITYDRSALFANMLSHLREAVRSCSSRITVLVVNNSGAEANSKIAGQIADSGLAEVCEVQLIDSPENNISVGRNLALDSCTTRYLAFIDDDEYPRADWLEKLIGQQLLGAGDMVGGPIVPVYPETAPAWVREIDLHNIAGLATGDVLRRTATGNCLLDLHAIGNHRFDREFGLSGGGDAMFFESLSRKGHKLIWCADAIVDETITEDRATARYAIYRFVKQGNNFARLMLVDASWLTRFLFRARAAVLSVVGILGGLVLYPFSAGKCARWWKGGFTNLGKLVRLRSGLYGR